MADNYKLPDDARKVFEEQLPENVALKLRRKFKELTSDPQKAGDQGADNIDAIGPDGS